MRVRREDEVSPSQNVDIQHPKFLGICLLRPLYHLLSPPGCASIEYGGGTLGKRKADTDSSTVGSSSLRQGKGHASFAIRPASSFRPPLAPAKVSADVRFPDLGTEGKSANRMSGSVVGLPLSGESDESNDNLKTLWIVALNFCRAECAVDTVDSTGHRDLLELLLRTSCRYWYMSIVSKYNFTSTNIF